MKSEESMKLCSQIETFKTSAIAQITQITSRDQVQFLYPLSLVFTSKQPVKCSVSTKGHLTHQLNRDRFFCYYEVTEVAHWDHFKVVTELFFSFLFVKEQVDACSKWHTGMFSEVQSYKVQNRQFLENQNFLNSLVSGANLKFPPEETCVMTREKE